jgi:hypothetical protein
VGRDVCVGQKGVLNAIVLKCWGEVFRLNKFSIPEGRTRRKQGGEMKPRGRKCSLPIEDLPWFTCMPCSYSYLLASQSWRQVSILKKNGFVSIEKRLLRWYTSKSESNQ